MDSPLAYGDQVIPILEDKLGYNKGLNKYLTYLLIVCQGIRGGEEISHCEWSNILAATAHEDSLWVLRIIQKEID